jgi:DNA-directed RNA polymerase subunit RPC12/RpoP
MNKMPICPDCGKEQDGNTEAETKKIEKPSNNDLNVCAYCGNISMFLNDGKSLRKINDMDKDFIKQNKAVFREVMNISCKIKSERAVEALKVFNKTYKRNNY